MIIFLVRAFHIVLTAAAMNRAWWQKILTAFCYFVQHMEKNHL